MLHPKKELPPSLDLGSVTADPPRCLAAQRKQFKQLGLKTRRATPSVDGKYFDLRIPVLTCLGPTSQLPTRFSQSYFFYGSRLFGRRRRPSDEGDGCREIWAGAHAMWGLSLSSTEEENWRGRRPIRGKPSRGAFVLDRDVTEHIW